MPELKAVSMVSECLHSYIGSGSNFTGDRHPGPPRRPVLPTILPARAAIPVLKPCSFAPHAAAGLPNSSRCMRFRFHDVQTRLHSP